MDIQFGFSKPSSRSFGLVAGGGETCVLGSIIAEGQPTGRLRNFLLASFESDAAAADAFFQSGGSVVTRTREGKGPSVVKWVVREGKPALLFAGARKGAKIEVKVLVEDSTWM